MNEGEGDEGQLYDNLAGGCQRRSLISLFLTYGDSRRALMISEEPDGINDLIEN